MPRRQPVPSRWLITDERSGEPLSVLLRRLPRGTGVVFRHYATPPDERRALLRRLARLAAGGHIMLVRAGDDPLGRAGVPTHGRQRSLTWPAHDRAQAVRAVRAGARIVFVSPVFATRSHPGAGPLGPLRAAAVARGLPIAAIAMGGMTPRRFGRLRPLGFVGWAGIDAWSDSQSGRQKRNAVPT